VTAQEQALETIREAMTRDPAPFIALQFLGMLVPDALAPLRDGAEDDIIGRILSVPPAPEPVYWRREAGGGRRPGARKRPQVIAVGGPVGKVREVRRPHRDRSLFSRWMEGEIAWSPAVMGWTDDDPRVDQMREMGEYE
jgi:hypothetical protein